jgi:tetrahydromethanopterin:alpha-L-glutamate ligase
MRPSLERLGDGHNGRRPIVGLVVDSWDWHARQLADAFAARGIATSPIRLPLCGVRTHARSGLHIDGFGENLPNAVVVRTMSGGTFEAITLRLGVLHALRERGVMVWNDARAIERCVDKSMTSFLLARAGIATPETWVTESFEQARAIIESQAGDGGLVLKPLFGSQGRGLSLIGKPEDLSAAANKTGVYYLQRFVGVERDGYHDFRLLVVRGRVIAAMQRHSSHWITNVKRGGRPVAVAVNDEMAALAVRAAAAVGADFAGVDIVYTADRQPTVLEVNSMPAWSGLQKVTSANVAAMFVDAFKATLAAHAAQETTA